MKPKLLPSSNSLPKHVFVKGGDWYVRRLFPTKERDEKGRLVYIPVAKKCDPQTSERVAEIIVEIENEFYAELYKEQHPSVGQFLEGFLRSKTDNIASRTLDYYNDLYERYIKGTSFAALSLVDLNPQQGQSTPPPILVQRFCEEIKRQRTADVARKVHALLRSAFSQAVLWGQLAANPAKGIVLGRAPDAAEVISYFDKDEARRFIEVCEWDDRFIIFHLALETGMRPGEYLALRRDIDVDLDSLTVHVRRSLVLRNDGSFEIKEYPKTKAGRRTLHISERLAARLRRQYELIEDMAETARQRRLRPLVLDHMKRTGANHDKRARTREHAGEILKNLETLRLMFPSADGSYISRLNLNRRELKGEKGALVAAKLNPKQHSLYSLRHSFCVLLIEAGVDLLTIANMMGHSDPVMVLRRYGHVLPSMRSGAEEKLAQALY